jgi:hypothetical protein
MSCEKIDVLPPKNAQTFSGENHYILNKLTYTHFPNRSLAQNLAAIR